MCLPGMACRQVRTLSCHYIAQALTRSSESYYPIAYSSMSSMYNNAAVPSRREACSSSRKGSSGSSAYMSSSTGRSPLQSSASSSMFGYVMADRHARQSSRSQQSEYDSTSLSPLQAQARPSQSSSRDVRYEYASPSYTSSSGSTGPQTSWRPADEGSSGSKRRDSVMSHYSRSSQASATKEGRSSERNAPPSSGGYRKQYK